ncbi:MAG: hypothetical protein AAB922_06820 [Patescibacteria group bacterium]
MSEQDTNVELDTTNEPTEEVVNTEEVEETVVDTETDDPAVETAKLKEANKRLFERAKKAEAEAKELKAKAFKSSSQPAQQVDTDELRLIARGLSDEEIDQAKVISKGKGISLAESLKDPLFVSYQKDLKEQQRVEKAKLGASKGSGQEGEEPLVKSGMTAAEHKEVWKKALGR